MPAPARRRLGWARGATAMLLKSMLKVDDTVQKYAAAFDYDSNGVTAFEG